MSSTKQKKTDLYRSCVLSVLLAGIAFGCCQSTTCEKTTDAAPLSQQDSAQLEEDNQTDLSPALLEMKALHNQAEQFISQGETETGLALIKRIMQEAPPEHRSDCAYEAITLLLNNQLLDAAQAFFLENSQNDPLFAHAFFGLIENNMAANKRFAELSGWCEKLAESPFATNFLVSVAQWHFQALLETQHEDAAKQILTRYENAISQSDWISLINSLAQTLLANNDLKAYRGLLDFLESTPKKEQPKLTATYIALRLKLAIAEKQWQEACSIFIELTHNTDEANAASYFSQLHKSLILEQKYDLADNSSLFALSLTNRPGLRKMAAMAYLRPVLIQHNVPKTIERIQELSKQNFDNTALVSWLNEIYSDAMRKGTKDDLKAILSLGQPLLKDKLMEHDRALLAGFMLDVMFRLDLFEDAAAIIDLVMPGHDQDWHASMKNKILAHLALQQGKKKEALERFTRFLNEYAVTFEKTKDPITGDTITRDMVLALNHKRIGELQAELGHSTEAENSFAQARTFYEAALKTVQPETDQAKRLKADRDSMPLKVAPAQ